MGTVAGLTLLRRRSSSPNKGISRTTAFAIVASKPHKQLTPNTLPSQTAMHSIFSIKCS